VHHLLMAANVNIELSWTRIFEGRWSIVINGK
jgi:hypothetical protein